MDRQQLLATAALLIDGSRDEDYGPAEANFRRIAQMWSAIFDHSFTQEDVALAMVLVKIARLSWDQSKPDSWIDIAGYAALGGEISGNKLEQRSRLSSKNV